MRVKDGERVISKLFTIIELFLINNSVTSTVFKRCYG